MHDAMAENANVGVVVTGNRFTASHAARKERVDRASHFLDGGIVRA